MGCRSLNQFSRYRGLFGFCDGLEKTGGGVCSVFDVLGFFGDIF